MNAAQAKQIRLTDILARLGHTPAKTSGDDVWYPSPFREEEEPSFKINVRENVWYDFGAGEGGNVLDFMMRLNQHRSVSQALQELESLMGRPSKARDTETLELFATAQSIPVSPKRTAENTLTVRKVQPLQNAALVQYLASRGIPRGIAAAYVQEMYYTRDEKPYFAIAFANDEGGYELRNPYFKGVQGTKATTLLLPQNQSENASKTVAIFEGFIDFLSWLVWQNQTEPKTAVLIMNSVALKARAEEQIRENGFENVHLYLDHDNAGYQLTTHFQESLSGCTVTDCSNLYADYKDMNAMLMANPVQKRTATGR